MRPLASSKSLFHLRVAALRSLSTWNAPRGAESGSMAVSQVDSHLWPTLAYVTNPAPHCTHSLARGEGKKRGPRDDTARARNGNDSRLSCVSGTQRAECRKLPGERTATVSLGSPTATERSARLRQVTAELEVEGRPRRARGSPGACTGRDAAQHFFSSADFNRIWRLNISPAATLLQRRLGQHLGTE